MDHLFFYISKLSWLIISPDSILIQIFGIGLFLLLKNKLNAAKKIFSGLFTLVLLIGFLPIGEWILYPLEKQYSANPELHKVDGIILLGGAEDPLLSSTWNQPAVNSAAERVFSFIQLSKEHPQAKMVFTGGSNSMVSQEDRGADAIKNLLNQQGLNTLNILFERESRNTWENAVYTKKLVQPKDEENWVLITTAWHMHRSVGIFCKVGWDVIPYPVDFNSKPNHLLRLDWDFSKNLKNLKIGIKEWVGIITYNFSGKMCS